MLQGQHDEPGSPEDSCGAAQDKGVIAPVLWISSCLEHCTIVVNDLQGLVGLITYHFVLVQVQMIKEVFLRLGCWNDMDMSETSNT